MTIQDRMTNGRPQSVLKANTPVDGVLLVLFVVELVGVIPSLPPFGHIGARATGRISGSTRQGSQVDAETVRDLTGGAQFPSPIWAGQLSQRRWDHDQVLVDP
jgi:hypothetical protein